MHTLRTCRRQAIHPEQAGCWTDRDQRLFVRGVLDGLLGTLDRLPMNSRERERVFDRLFETDRLVGWLMEVGEVLAGRREPSWIGRGPKEERVIHKLPARWRALKG